MAECLQRVHSVDVRLRYAALHCAGCVGVVLRDLVDWFVAPMGRWHRVNLYMRANLCICMNLYLGLDADLDDMGDRCR